MVDNIYNLLDMQKDKNIPIQSRKNCVTVLGRDPALAGKIKFNTLSNRKNVEGALPWNKSEVLREWTNIDSEYLIYYMETYYLLNSDKKILSALEMIADTNKFNPFIDMLNSISWDGVPRIKNLLTDYLGVEKNDYSIHCMELLMLAVISRAFNPGTKFDYVLVLSGRQGIGKSSFFMKLCCNDDWYLENLKTIDKGKDAAELIQGKIIVEFNELLAVKSAIEGVKSFVTARSDEYRGAYAREKERHYRTCVFVGTTNDTQFLVDKTGNRRFLPLQCGVMPITRSIYKCSENDIVYKENRFKPLDETGKLIESLGKILKTENMDINPSQKFGKMMYKLYQKYSFTPADIQSQIDSLKDIKEDFVNNIFKRLNLNILNKKKAKMDLDIFLEKFISINGDREKVFKEDREAYLIKISSDDIMQMTRIDTASTGNRPLQCSETFFDGKKSILNTKECKNLHLCYNRKRGYLGCFTVQFSVTKGWGVIKTYYVPEEDDIQNVLQTVFENY